MHITTSFAALAALVSMADARNCINQTVPVNITARTAVFQNSTLPITDLDAGALVRNLIAQGSNYSAQVLTGYQTISKSYNFATTFCAPDSTNGSKPVLQLLTHGIGFDRSYWDFPYNNYNYSYVNAALAAGYYTLSYDRLGVGQSSKGDPLNEIQGPLEVQSLVALIEMFGQGKFPGVNQSFGSNIIPVGHSFGSLQSAAVANIIPNAISGIVLTGYSGNASFMDRFFAGSNFQQAKNNAPLRFGAINGTQAMTLLTNSPLADYLSGVDLTTLPPPENLPSGYLVANDITANQLDFLLPGYFDVGALQMAEETKQTITAGELFTLAVAPLNNTFTGPVLVLTGVADLPFCGGNCTNTGGNPQLSSVATSAQGMFPKVAASNFTTYVQPRTAHGINLHYNSTGAYGVITSFLQSKGLAP